MRFLIYTYLFFSLLCVFFSCSYKQDQILFEKKQGAIDSATQKNIVLPGAYQIKPQDILEVRNLQNMSYISGEPSAESGGGGGGNSSQGQQFRVEQDGTVALPVIGRVPVEGLTRAEAASKIEGLYRKNLLRDPIIDVKIVNLKITILGEIKSQGNYPLIKDKTTLVEMIGEAGGLTERANEKNVEIIRGSQDNPQVTRIDLSDIKSLTDPATILQNGDVIYIAQNRRAVRADKLSNFSIIIQPVLIVFNTALIIFTLAHH
jgi:polysaccharide export outer membrane protein